MDNQGKTSKRFNHRFTVIQLFSLVLSYLILLSPSQQNGKYSYFLGIGLFLLYFEWGILYLLEKIYKPKEENYDEFKLILEKWAMAFIGVHIFMLIAIIIQIKYSIVLSFVWLISFIVIIFITILFFFHNRVLKLPNLPLTEKLHKYDFPFHKKANYVILAGWFIHFGNYPQTLKVIALIIAFLAFMYYHLGNFVYLKELDELEKQIKLEQVYLGLPIAAAIFYVAEFLRSTYKLNFTTLELLFAVSAVSLFLSFIVRKKYE